MPRKATVKSDVVNNENESIENEKVSAPRAKKQMKSKQLSPNMIVPVRNGFHGMLVYQSKKTGETYTWYSFGDIQDIELQELRNVKSSSKGFFENGWFLIDDPEVIAYLGLERVYENFLSYDEFDTVFNLQIDEMIARISMIPAEQKRSLAYRAKQLIDDGVIDSIKVINKLEECLGVELIDRSSDF